MTGWVTVPAGAYGTMSNYAQALHKRFMYKNDRRGVGGLKNLSHGNFSKDRFFTPPPLLSNLYMFYYRFLGSFKKTHIDKFDRVASALGP